MNRICHTDFDFKIVLDGPIKLAMQGGGVKAYDTAFFFFLWYWSLNSVISQTWANSSGDPISKKKKNHKKQGCQSA
jgi:hypothetical protein